MFSFFILQRRLKDTSLIILRIYKSFRSYFFSFFCWPLFFYLFIFVNCQISSRPWQRVPEARWGLDPAIRFTDSHVPIWQPTNHQPCWRHSVRYSASKVMSWGQGKLVNLLSSVVVEAGGTTPRTGSPLESSLLKSHWNLPFLNLAPVLLPAKSHWPGTHQPLDKPSFIALKKCSVPTWWASGMAWEEQQHRTRLTKTRDAELVKIYIIGCSLNIVFFPKNVRKFATSPSRQHLAAFGCTKKITSK